MWLDVSKHHTNVWPVSANVNQAGTWGAQEGCTQSFTTLHKTQWQNVLFCWRMNCILELQAGVTPTFAHMLQFMSNLLLCSAVYTGRWKPLPPLLPHHHQPPEQSSSAEVSELCDVLHGMKFHLVRFWLDGLSYSGVFIGESKNMRGDSFKHYNSLYDIKRLKMEQKSIFWQQNLWILISPEMLI